MVKDYSTICLVAGCKNKPTHYFVDKGSIVRPGGRALRSGDFHSDGMVLAACEEHVERVSYIEGLSKITKEEADIYSIIT